VIASLSAIKRKGMIEMKQIGLIRKQFGLFFEGRFRNAILVFRKKFQIEIAKLLALLCRYFHQRDSADTKRHCC